MPQQCEQVTSLTVLQFLLETVHLINQRCLWTSAPYCSQCEHLMFLLRTKFLSVHKMVPRAGWINFTIVILNSGPPNYSLNTGWIYEMVTITILVQISELLNSLLTRLVFEVNLKCFKQHASVMNFESTRGTLIPLSDATRQRDANTSQGVTSVEAMLDH
jgi:hypothetical protein